MFNRGPGLFLFFLVFVSSLHAETILKVETSTENVQKKIETHRFILFPEGYVQETPRAINIFTKGTKELLVKEKGTKVYVPTTTNFPQMKLVFTKGDQTFGKFACDIFNSTDRTLEICFHFIDPKKFDGLRETLKTLGVNSGYEFPKEIISRGIPIPVSSEFKGFKTVVDKIEGATAPAIKWTPESIEAQLVKIYPKRL